MTHETHPLLDLPDYSTDGTPPQRISRYVYEMSRQAPFAGAFEYSAYGESYKVPLPGAADLAAIYVCRSHKCFMFYASPRMPHDLCCKIASGETKRRTPDGHVIH